MAEKKLLFENCVGAGFNHNSQIKCRRNTEGTLIKHFFILIHSSLSTSTSIIDI